MGLVSHRELSSEHEPPAGGDGVGESPPSIRIVIWSGTAWGLGVHHSPEFGLPEAHWDSDTDACFTLDTNPILNVCVTLDMYAPPMFGVSMPRESRAL